MPTWATPWPSWSHWWKSRCAGSIGSNCSSPRRRAMNAVKAESRAYFRALGKHIEELRKEIGVSQSELARGLGASPQTIYAIEVGDRRVSVPMLIKLAEFFQVPVGSLA